MRIPSWLCRHIYILPLAIVMPLLISLPLILFPYLAGDEYRGINIAHFGTDQHFYLTRAREVLDGNRLGNAILRDGKDRQDPYFTWNERVLLAPYRWLGVAERINVNTLYTLMNGIGVALLIVLLYIFAYQLSGNRLLSATLAMAVVGGYTLVFNRTIFYQDMNLYGRAMTPYLSTIALFTYLNFLVRDLYRPRLYTAIAASVAFGALFYVYLFAWTYVLAFNGMLLALYLIWREWGKAKRLALIIGGGILLGAYNIYQLLSHLLLANGRAVRYIHFVQHTHAPLFSLVGTVLLIVFAVYWWKHRRDERAPLILAFILAGWAVLNQQLVTGMRMQPGHYYWYFVVPVGIILGLFMSWSLLQSSKLRTAACIIILGIVFLNTAVGQYRSTLVTMPAKLNEQRFGPILEELQKDHESAVILTAGNDEAYLITIFTHHDLFWHDAAMYFQPDVARLKRVLAVWLFLHAEARQDVAAFLQSANDDRLPATMYTYTYMSLEGFSSGWSYPEYLDQRARLTPELMQHRQTLIAELVQEVDRLAKEPNALNDVLALDQVEYMLWDQKKYPEWDMGKVPHLREILSVNDLHLYRRD